MMMMMMSGGVQDYLLMDPRVRAVDGDTMVNEMRQNIEIMLRKKKHAIQVTASDRTYDAVDLTKSSATAASQSKFCQLLHNSIGTSCTRNPGQVDVFE